MVFSVSGRKEKGVVHIHSDFDVDGKDYRIHEFSQVQTFTI